MAALNYGAANLADDVMCNNLGRVNDLKNLAEFVAVILPF